MVGNANSGPRKQKLWRDALLLTINRLEDGIEEAPKGRTVLQKLVSTQVNMALGGDSTSMRDIADRLDGKPAQAIVGGDEDDNPIAMIHRIERVIIDSLEVTDSASIPIVIEAEPI